MARYFTFIPGVAPASGDSRKMSFPPGPAASTMPSEMPKRILRGLRFASTSVRRPTQLLGRVRRADAGEHRALSVADVERQLQQLVRAFDRLGSDDLRDAQIELREVFDRDFAAASPAAGAAAAAFASGFAAASSSCRTAHRAASGRRASSGARTARSRWPAGSRCSCCPAAAARRAGQASLCTLRAVRGRIGVRQSVSMPERSCRLVEHTCVQALARCADPSRAPTACRVDVLRSTRSAACHDLAHRLAELALLVVARRCASSTRRARAVRRSRASRCRIEPRRACRRSAW